MTPTPPAGLAGDLSRRDFVRLLGASMALAGVTGCVREPSEPIFPYVHPPDEGAGTALHFATSMTLDGFATGLLVRSVDGRPIKIEGNPDHPASLGAAGVQQQGALLQLYDPHRAGHVGSMRAMAPWADLLRRYGPAALAQRAGERGGGLCLVMDPVSSPVSTALLDRLRTAYPDLVLHFVSTVDGGGALAAHRAAFGKALLATADLASAEVVVALEADPLARGPWHLRHARDFGARRRSGRPSRLHVAQVAPSPTSTLADQRVALAPSALRDLALVLVRRIATSVAAPGIDLADVALPAAATAWVDAVAADLLAHRGTGAVVAGEGAPAELHLAAAALNELLDNTGRTVWYHPSPIYDAGEPTHDAARFEAAQRNTAFGVVIVTAANPVYTAPSDLTIADTMRRAGTSLYLGEYADETAATATHFAPQAHFLESWDAARARDGTLSTVQPLIAPIFGGHTTTELLAVLLGDTRPARSLLQALSPEAATTEALRQGFLPGTGAARTGPRIDRNALRTLAASERPPAGIIELSFPATAMHDGRFAGNPWLQELPDPVTSLTWDNALLLAPATAARIGVASGDMVELRDDRAAVTAPVLVVPGHADDAGSLALGYGRRGDGILADVIGVDTGPLRHIGSPLANGAIRVIPAGAHRTLALTQQHWTIDGRAADITAGREVAPPPGALYHATRPGHDGFEADQWAMTIDLDRCTGCSACVVACQAENNIPVVGRDGVLQSREMQWIRIHRYLDGAPGAGGLVTQPMLCQHCENAPCEYVCPVNATVHSDDGLNEMVYNRCVGTRFCSNNCPYKVRRFNWLNYHEGLTPVDELLFNPDVTVRARGVMEKCTFCVQRIRAAQVASQLAGDPRTGPVVTACQQACPTGAILFGSLTNPDDPVTASFGDDRAFAALSELNTRPRVRYLRRRHRTASESS